MTTLVATDVRRAADERLLADLGAPPPEGSTPDPRLRALAEKLLASGDPLALVTNLLARTRHDGPCAPREVTAITPPPPRASTAPRTMPPPGRGAEGGGGGGTQAFVPFRINWGQRHGADPRRLLALVCRRGGIEGFQVGAIRIGQTASTFEVAVPVAGGFAQAVRKPDARDPRIRIDPMEPVPPGASTELERPRAPRPARPAPTDAGGGGLAPPRRQPPRWS
ncbi:MAG: DbpA RNA binding domain-containing protein [Minicystis sp.]